MVSYHGEDIARAACVGSKDGKHKFNLLDWGNIYVTDASNIYKISPELAALPIISRTVDVKLKSGKPLYNVDVEATIRKLNNCESFKGVIELVDKNKYAITIDDSLITFKN